MDKPTKQELAGGNVYAGRGPNIPDNVDHIIAEIYLKDKKAPAKEIMDKVHNTLLEYGLQLRSGWPGLSAIQQRLTKIRAKDKKMGDGPLDWPWSLVSLPQYPISPEAIPFVLKVWARALLENKPITIREALWVGRLYPIFKAFALGELGESSKVGEMETPLTLSASSFQAKLNHILTSLPTDLSDVDALWAFASTLAIQEKILGLEYPDTREGILSYWLNDAEVYGILPEGEPSASELSTRISQEFRAVYEKSKQRKEAHHERPHSQER